MSAVFFIILAAICCINLIRCILLLKKYKSGCYVCVKQLSYGAYRTEAKGSNLRSGKIRWNGLTVEIPMKNIDSAIKTTISTTNFKAGKYKGKEYIDVFVIYRPDGCISNVYLKEDMATIPELIFSSIIGCISFAIAIAVITIK